MGSSITRKIIFSLSFFGTLHRPRGLDFVNFDTISVLSRELRTPHVPLLGIISASFRDVKMTQHAWIRCIKAVQLPPSRDLTAESLPAD